jgi:hypothetical protein
MIPAGYMLKMVASRPEWLHAAGVEDICAVSGCVSPPFSDYVNNWKHNGYWFFNSPEEIDNLCRTERIESSGHTLFYYEVHDKQFDRDARKWSVFDGGGSFATQVVAPKESQIIGFDVVTFSGGAGPECSPLSCNALAAELTVNRHCLFETLEEAERALDDGKFDDTEPGPYRIFAVYLVGPQACT